MSNSTVFYADGESPEMINAIKKAQSTFKYFWRELSWEYRRIIPGLDVACAKIIFTQHVDNSDKPLIEHMWINEVGFDGDYVYGTLVNDPNQLTNIENGDPVRVPLTHLSDWLFCIDGKTYGGFTIQQMRSQMKEQELNEHDEAWGLNFGDYNDVLIVNKQKEHPENLTEHPMSKNMGDSLANFIKENPAELTNKDENGYTLLHREAIAGNKTSVEVLLTYGADKTAQTNSGKTALDFANQLEWEHLIPILQ